ncbi:hypothetical protein C2S52_017936 [Perilla frutescens var. hirtella]|nr:hypothetical protein C2S52_017936 [Perilla frutescens var. hirtella]
MIFGNCTLTKSVLDLKLKSEVLVTADDDNFCCGKTSKPSSTIQIKQEYERVEEGKNEAIWDSKKVKKKKRSKLPEYRRRLVVGPKYDDVLIYEKWMSIPENEIGLGAELLLQMSPAAALPSSTSTSTYIN